MVKPKLREPERIPSPPPTLDFRDICRDSEKVYCEISIDTTRGKHPWLKLGAIDLRNLGPDNMIWNLSAHLANYATDFEHSSAHVVSIDLVGLQLKFVSDHQFYYQAWVGHDPESFRVPDAGYNPLTLPETRVCAECKREEKHLIVPEGYYLPDANPEMWKRVRHWPLVINIGSHL